MKLNPPEVTSKITAIILFTAICFSMITIASCWNDDDEIIKWNPTWLSNFRYTRPIGIRQRGYIYKRVRLQFLYDYHKLRYINQMNLGRAVY